MGNDDATIVARVLSGDIDAFDLLFKKYARLVWSIGAGKGVKELEDLGQEVFVQAFRKLSQLADHTKFKQWLCVIALRLAWQVKEHERRNRLSGAQPLNSGEDAEALAQLIAEVQDSAAASHLVVREWQRLVWDATERLPEPHKTVAKDYMAKNSETETAKKIALSVGRVRSLRPETWNKLRRILNDLLAELRDSAGGN